MSRPPVQREHGTTRGYSQHRSRGEDQCGACRDAWNEANRQAWATARASAPPRERLTPGRRPAWRPATPAEATVWADHLAGSLILGGTP